MPRRDQVRHPRSPAARWARRLFGVAGTAVVLAVGVVIATMVLSGDDGEVVAPAPAATPTPSRARAGRAAQAAAHGTAARTAPARGRPGPAARATRRSKLDDYRADHSCAC